MSPHDLTADAPPPDPDTLPPRPPGYIGRWAFWFLIVVSVAPALFGGYWFLRELQYREIAVVRDFQVDKRTLVPKDGPLVLSGSFDKAFKEYICKYDGMQWYVRIGAPDGSPAKLRVEHDEVPEGSVAVATTFGDLRRDPRANNRPKGWNPYRDWSVHVEEWPAADVALGRVYHMCLGVWPTVTDLPPIYYGDLKRPRDS